MANVARPSREQLTAVAMLRYAQSGGPPAGRDRYVADLAASMAAHRATHLCRVLVDGDVVVGCGFLVLTERTPSPDKTRRLSADVQTVLGAPEHRGAGLGAQLVASLVELARSEGAEYVTVHGNERALGLYRRAGFGTDWDLLFMDLDRAASDD